MLATRCLVIAMLFHFVTGSVPDSGDDLPPLGEEPSYSEHPQDPGEAPSVEHNASTLLVCDMYLRSARIDALPQAIRASDLTLGLRRIPAGFHETIKADGVEWQTTNAPVRVDQTVIQWNEHVLRAPFSVIRLKFPSKYFYSLKSYDEDMTSSAIVRVSEHTKGSAYNNAIDLPSRRTYL